ncbi:MAG: hypothetical protein ACREXR_17705, partial [Gammaproteobacteria bacterium]
FSNVGHSSSIGSDAFGKAPFDDSVAHQTLESTLFSRLSVPGIRQCGSEMENPNFVPFRSLTGV